jgi:hypothetical protein
MHSLGGMSAWTVEPISMQDTVSPIYKAHKFLVLSYTNNRSLLQEALKYP